MTATSVPRRQWRHLIGGIAIVSMAGAVLLGATRSNGEAAASPYFLLNDGSGQITLTGIDKIQQPAGGYEMDLALGNVALVDVSARTFIIERGGDLPVFDSNAPASTHVVTVHDEPASLGVNSLGAPVSLEWRADTIRYSITVETLSRSSLPTEQQIIDTADSITPASDGLTFTISGQPTDTKVLFTSTKNSTATSYQLHYSAPDSPATIDITVTSGIHDTAAASAAATNAETVSSGGQQRWIEQLVPPAGGETNQETWIVSWSPGPGVYIHLVATAITKDQALAAANEVTPVTYNEWSTATTTTTR